MLAGYPSPCPALSPWGLAGHKVSPIFSLMGESRADYNRDSVIAHTTTLCE
jgi:hypothetical protein